MTQTTQPSMKAYSFLFIAIIGWGFSSSFVEFGLQYLNPFPFLFYRFLIASLVLTPYALIAKKEEIKKLLLNKLTWYIIVFETLGIMFQYLGQEQSVPAGLASLLSLLFILIVPFISPFILDEKLTLNHVAAMTIAFIGVILISSEGKLENIFAGSQLGVALLLASALSYAFYIAFSSKLNKSEEVDSFSLFYLVLLFTAVISLFASLTLDHVTAIPGSAWKWLIALVIVSTLIAYMGYFLSLKEVSANTASLLLPLQALIPFTIDFIYLNRTYSYWIILGSVLVIVAMLIVVGEPYLKEIKLKLQMVRTKVDRNCGLEEILGVIVV